MTLIELMVVLVILGVVAGIAIPRYNALVDRAEAAAMAENAHAAQVGVVELEGMPRDSLPPPGRYDEAAVRADSVLARRIPARALRGARGIRVVLVLEPDPELAGVMTFAFEYEPSSEDARQAEILRAMVQYTGDRYGVDPATGRARFDFFRPNRFAPPPPPPRPQNPPAAAGDSTCARDAARMTREERQRCGLP